MQHLIEGQQDRDYYQCFYSTGLEIKGQWIIVS